MYLEPGTRSYDVLDAVATAAERHDGVLELQWQREDGTYDIDMEPIEDVLDEDYASPIIRRTLKGLRDDGAIDVGHTGWPDDLGQPSMSDPSANRTEITVTRDGYRELYEGRS